jgi:hypothetical protein
MWIYNNKEIGDDEIEGHASFVYIITNLETGKKYIGKKIFKSIQRKKVKGKTRRKKSKKIVDGINTLVQVEHFKKMLRNWDKIDSNEKS